MSIYFCLLTEFVTCKINENIFKVRFLHLLWTLKACVNQFINQFIRCVKSYNITGIHNCHPVAEGFGFIHVMGGKNHSCAFITNVADQLP